MMNKALTKTDSAESNPKEKTGSIVTIINKFLNSLNLNDSEPVKLTIKEQIDSYLLETISIFTWTYLIIKLFIFDIDIFLFSKFIPTYSWILNLKLIFIVSLISIFWFLRGTGKIFRWSLYVTFYPFILCFLIFPIFVIKQKSWVFAFAIINTIISFFKSIKYNFILFSIFLLTVSLVFISHNKQVLISCSCVLISLTIITYIRKFWLALKPWSIFGVHIKIFKKIRNTSKDSFKLDETIKGLPIEALDEKQLQKWTETLQTSVLFNRLCLFFSKKLQEYQNSGWLIIPSISAILFLIVFTVITFSIINFALFKVSPLTFTYSIDPTFFTFFYYSFNNLIFNSISELSPSSVFTQSISMLESFLAIALSFIFVTLYLSIKSEKNAIELKEIIENIEEEGKSMENFIKEEYSLNSIFDALEQLQKLKGNMVSLLFSLSKGLDK